MGSIGDPWDNALAESFFASLEKELLRRERFTSREQARLRVFWYIECFYNPRRRHSNLGMLSPIDYETNTNTNTNRRPSRPNPKVSTETGYFQLLVGRGLFC